ncbi:hypothetical protein SNL152K_4726 [Streptomyces sp. NL15-2K]|nr:hypothetical protein SNL152K_4726 [Streptomyces sp. NL15-2K]
MHWSWTGRDWRRPCSGIGGHEWLTAARDADLPVVTSAAVLVEVIHPRINDAALRWTLSRLRVEPVT